MRPERLVPLVLATLVLHACGGDDSPTAPTVVNQPAQAPIVVTVTAQVASSSVQGIRSFGEQSAVENRNVRVTGTVDVTGGSASVSASVSYTYTPDGGQSPVTQQMEAFPTRTIAPGTGGVSFTADIPFELPPGTSTAGDVVVSVSGTDERGSTVNVATESLPVSDADTKRAAFDCVPDASTLCLLDNDRFRVTVDWEDFGNNTGQGMVTDGQRFNDGGWFNLGGASGGILSPDGFDIFLQMTDRCGEFDRFWVFAAASTNVEFTLTVTDTQENVTKTYFNPLGTVPDAITDTQAFATCP